jgi:peroxiredoxin
MNLFSILAFVLASVGILAGGWLGWQLLRQNGRLLLRLEEVEKRLDTLEFGGEHGPPGLPLDSAAPDFELPDLAGEHKTLAQFRGQPLLLIFFNPACGFCRDMAPKLAAFRGMRRSAEPPPSALLLRGTGDAALDSQTFASAPSESAVTAGAVQNNGDPSPNDRPLVLIITTGDAQQNREFLSQHKITGPVLLQKQSEVATAYQANGTPSGYLISAEGKIASELAIGAEALLALAAGNSEVRTPNSELDESLLASAPTAKEAERASRFTSRSLARSKIKRDGLKAGTRAPEFRLPRLDGQGELALEKFRGKRVLLVFSSPHCGPCNELAPKLETFHRQHPEVEVIMISKGDPKENRAKVKEHGLTFPVVLQQQWETSRLYAMFATPMAYLIDAGGNILADVAVGVGPILELLRPLERRLEDHPNS